MSTLDNSGLITREELQALFITGAKPGEDIWYRLFASIVFKNDDLRALFLQIATQAEALAGVDNTKIMTALRVKSVIDTAIAALKGAVSEDGNTLKKLKDLIAGLAQAKKDKTDVIFSIGDYKPSEQAANHNGWLLCNGNAVSRTTYSELFKLIGESYGRGDGSATFNLPDFRGRFLLTSGQGAGLTNRTRGQKGGAEKHTLSTNEMPAHSHSCNWAGDHRHSIYDSGHKHWFESRQERGGAGWNGGRPYGTDRPNNYGFNTSNAYTGISLANAGNHTHTIGNAGGGQGHNNMPPFLVVGHMFIYSGVLN